MNNLARAYSHTGQPGRAIPILEDVLKRQRVKLGEGHLHTLTTMSNLAQDYCDAGRLDLAIAMNEQALRAQRLHLGEDHDLTIATISELALVYKADGRLDLAIAMNEQALRKRRTKFGPDHPGDPHVDEQPRLARVREVGRLDLADPDERGGVAAATGHAGPRPSRHAHYPEEPCPDLREGRALPGRRTPVPRDGRVLGPGPGLVPFASTRTRSTPLASAWPASGSMLRPSPSSASA